MLPYFAFSQFLWSQSGAILVLQEWFYTPGDAGKYLVWIYRVSILAVLVVLRTEKKIVIRTPAIQASARRKI
jgi:hypothetical protein